MKPSQKQLKEARIYLKRSRECSGLANKLGNHPNRKSIAAQSMIDLGLCFQALGIAEAIEKEGF